MFVQVKAPAAVQEQHDREVAEVEQYQRARKLAISATKREKLDRYLKRALEAWEDGTGDLHQRLQELNRFFEGDKEEVDFPFGAGQSSSIDVRLAASKARTLRAHFNRVVFADSNPFVAELLPGAKREDQDNLAEAQVNWSVEKETNGIEVLKDTPIPCYRDGLALVYGEWERRVERGVERVTYENREQFEGDYPDAKSAGLSDDVYEEVLTELETMDQEVHAEFEVDFVAQNQPVYTLFPLAKFIFYPLAARDLRLTAEVYGYHYPQGDRAFRQAIARDYYDKEPAEECRKRSGADRDAWDASRDQIEGIDGSDQERASYRIAKLTVSYDMDQDRVPERYLVWYDMDAHKSLRIERYGLFRNTPNVVPFGFVNRDGRLIKTSLLWDGLDMYRTVNALHRHRSNQRRITDSVTLMLPKRLKEDVDLGAEYTEFRPGMTMWLPDDLKPESWPRQFVVQSTSRTNESIDEESLVARYLDGLIGISEGQSGRETPIDPAAPAAKTRMLLERADFRIEDLVDEWRRSVPDFIDLHNALYYQNARSKISFMMQQGGQMAEASIRTALLADPRRRFALKAPKPSVTPEYEMNRIAALVAMAFQMQFPVSANPQLIIEAWNDYVTASRVPMPERFKIQAGPGGQVMMGGQPVDMAQLQQSIQMMAAMGQAGEGGKKTTTKGKR